MYSGELKLQDRIIHQKIKINELNSKAMGLLKQIDEANALLRQLYRLQKERGGNK